MTTRVSILTAAVMSLALPAQAEVDSTEFVQCLEENGQDRGTILICLEAQHASCDSFSADDASAAALLCFQEASSAWTHATRAWLEALGDRLSDTKRSVANIEVKYTSLAGLLQCDRQEELALLGSVSSEHIKLQKARCTATALGFTFGSLVLQTQERE